MCGLITTFISQHNAYGKVDLDNEKLNLND